MTSFEIVFQDLKKKKQVAFIPFIMAGHPDLSKTEELIYLLDQEGADIIELGVPYSDPLADGPVIEKAAQRSIKNGTTIDQVFDCIKRVREKTKVPIVFLVYFNSILAYGLSRFTNKCLEAKVNGLIIPDLPLEERDELTPYLENTDISLIPLVTPTSDDRIKEIVSTSKGFIYCVSSLGVTGIRKDFDIDTESFLNRVRQYTHLPLAIGFGISNSKDIKRFSNIVDAVIVGSALVKIIEDSKCNYDEIKSFLKELTTAGRG